ncbi:ribose 5-phosphate isomerase B [bacterium]|nr:ribose 5-phosphate isomerase B [bacterium]
MGSSCSVALGSDHAGYQLKERIKEYLTAQKIPFEDFGTHSQDSVDYPDTAVRVSHSVRDRKHTYGVLICGSGIGMSITANKVAGIRAALCTSVTHARMGRLHNDANILTLGERYTDPDAAVDIVDTFLRTEFEGGRHQRRIDKIHRLTGC